MSNVRGFEKKYKVVSHYGTIEQMTARELCIRIEEDSKSDYNWIAPARELVNTCKTPGFPNDSSITIKIAILNCFANIEHRANSGGDRYRTDPRDEAAVEFCYNSLFGVKKEKAVSARKRFLTEIITMAIYTRAFDRNYHPGPTYQKLRQNFIKSKCEENIYKKNIEFKKLVEHLKEEFIQIVKKAEANGDFEEDKKKDEEQWREFYKKFKYL